MNKAFEKILERLEKEAYTITDTVCGVMFEAIRLSSAQQIVQEVAEEYNNGCCKHKWVFQESQHKTTVTGYEHYTAHYHRVDVFFCEKCCEIKKIEQKEDVNLPFGGTHKLSVYAPIWYQPKGE